MPAKIGHWCRTSTGRLQPTSGFETRVSIRGGTSLGSALGFIPGRHRASVVMHWPGLCGTQVALPCDATRVRFPFPQTSTALHPGPAPLAGEEVEHEVVGHLAALEPGPGHSPGIAVPLLAERLAASRIERPGYAPDHVDSKVRESVFEQQVLGFGAISAAAILAAHNLGLRLGSPVQPVDVGQPIRADHRAILEEADRESHPAREALGCLRAVPFPV